MTDAVTELERTVRADRDAQWMAVLERHALASDHACPCGFWFFFRAESAEHLRALVEAAS